MFCASKLIKRKEALEHCMRTNGEELSASYVDPCVM